MKKIIIAGITVIAAGFICFCIWLLCGGSSTCYYSQIDNTKIAQQTSDGGVIDFTGGLPYSYTLTAYDEDGEEKEITFGASRELKEGAFIRLTAAPVRGVTAWEEVQYEELPETVQSHYAAQADK